MKVGMYQRAWARVNRLYLTACWIARRSCVSPTRSTPAVAQKSAYQAC